MPAACRSSRSATPSISASRITWAGWATRPEIGAALLCVESIEDHEHFREVARRVSATKPAIALFRGRTEIGGPGVICADQAGIEGLDLAASQRPWPMCCASNCRPKHPSPTRSTW